MANSNNYYFIYTPLKEIQVVGLRRCGQNLSGWIFRKFCIFIDIIPNNKLSKFQKKKL